MCCSFGTALFGALQRVLIVEDVSFSRTLEQKNESPMTDDLPKGKPHLGSELQVFTLLTAITRGKQP